MTLVSISSMLSDCRPFAQKRLMALGLLQLPECFASILYLLALGYWQSILVVVVK